MSICFKWLAINLPHSLVTSEQVSIQPIKDCSTNKIPCKIRNYCPGSNFKKSDCNSLDRYLDMLSAIAKHTRVEW